MTRTSGRNVFHKVQQSLARSRRQTIRGKRFAPRVKGRCSTGWNRIPTDSSTRLAVFAKLCRAHRKYESEHRQAGPAQGLRALQYLLSIEGSGQKLSSGAELAGLFAMSFAYMPRFISRWLGKENPGERYSLWTIVIPRFFVSDYFRCQKM
jgi:hypothetical protein